MLLGFCQLALVAGFTANAYTNAFIANAFGGGLQGALLADQLGFGTTFNDYIGASALNNPATSNALLFSSFAPNSSPFNSYVNTYLGANALTANPNQFLLAGTLGGASQYQLITPYLANAFGGGFNGAILADTLFPPASFGVRSGSCWSGAFWVC